MESLIEFLEKELARRSWRPADLARAARLPDATISHILNGSRRAGPEVCNALARALDEPPERIFRLAGLLPSLPPEVEEETEAVRILRGLPPELRAAAMRMLRSLRPGSPRAPATPEPSSQAGGSASGPAGAAPPADRPVVRDRDPYLEVLEQLWDKAPDWKKRDIAAQIRATVEEYQREQEGGAIGRGGDEGRVTRPQDEGGWVTGGAEDEGQGTGGRGDEGRVRGGRGDEGWVTGGRGDEEQITGQGEDEESDAD